jgi:LPS-assembly lipoprotein
MKLRACSIGSILKIALATAMPVVMLTACGFHLRGSNADANLPFRTIFIGLPDNSPLGAELKRNIRSGNGTQVVREKKDAEAILEVLEESRDKLALTLNSQGRVREYALNYKMRFRIIDNAGKEFLPATLILLKRDMSFSESKILAKESEEELLYSDMQSDLVQQVLRRIAAIKLNPPS